MKEQFSGIAQKLSEPASAFDLREWLVMHVMGLGYKEATHFLRNIGKNNGLAILDRHILRMLKRLGVVHSIPNSINKKQYLEIEHRFKMFANDIGIVLDELDLVFWSMGTGEIRKPKKSPIKKNRRIVIPNRIYRGRIVALLRTMSRRQSIESNRLLHMIRPEAGNQNQKWFSLILTGLQRDGLIHIHSQKAKTFVSLPK